MAALCWSSREEIPNAQGKRNPSKTVGVARGHQRANTLKPYSQKTRQHIKKQRHYFADIGPSSQSYGFSSSHVRCENWTIKKAEHRKFDAFELWCLRRLWRVPWTTRRSNQSILKEISSEHSLQGLILKLKLQYFGHLMRKADLFENTLMLEKIEGGKGRG